MIVTDSAIAAKYVIKTHYIMRVVEFHPETQTVDLIQDVFEFTKSPFGSMVVTNEFGKDVTVTLNAPDYIEGVPVKQLRWGQFEIQACPVPGDTGYIEVFTNDTRDWVINGSESIPWSDDHFLKHCCVFVPFIPNHKNAAENYPADNTQLVIRSKNASITITDDGTTSSVKIGAKTMEISAEEGVSITGDVNVTGNVTASEDIKAGNVSLTEHTHTLASGAVNVTGSAAAQSNPAPIIVPKPDTGA